MVHQETNRQAGRPRIITFEGGPLSNRATRSRCCCWPDLINDLPGLWGYAVIPGFSNLVNLKNKRDIMIKDIRPIMFASDAETHVNAGRAQWTDQDKDVLSDGVRFGEVRDWTDGKDQDHGLAGFLVFGFGGKVDRQTDWLTQLTSWYWPHRQDDLWKDGNWWYDSFFRNYYYLSVSTTDNTYTTGRG